MQAIISRSIVPVLLLVGGVASLVYGTWFHGVPVAQDIIKQVEEEVAYEREITLREKLQEQADLVGMPWLADQARHDLATLSEDRLATVVDSVSDKRIETKTVTEKKTTRESEPALTLGMTTGGKISLADSGGLMRPVWDTTKGEDPGADADGICET